MGEQKDHSNDHLVNSDLRHATAIDDFLTRSQQSRKSPSWNRQYIENKRFFSAARTLVEGSTHDYQLAPVPCIRNEL